MSKNTDDRTMFKIDKETESSVVIPDDAFESIVLFAALGTDGVYSIGNITRDKIDSVGKNGASSVKVEVIDKDVKVYVSVIISFGYRIPEITKNLMDRIKTNVENMTDFNVKSVNIKVSGINTDNR